MKNTIFLFLGLFILNLNFPAFASNCGIDEDTGLCLEGECRLDTGEIGVCSSTVDGCQCQSIH